MITRASHSFALFLLLVVMAGCSGCGTSVEPGLQPPQPRFVDISVPPAAIDHGFFADPGQDFIVIEWYSNSPDTTTGYVLYRSNDDSLNSDGTLRNRVEIKTLESPNQLVEPLDSSFIDSVGTKEFGKAYYYQIESYHTSGSNRKTFSKPSTVNFFTLLPKPTLNSPNSQNIAKEMLTFNWSDPAHGGLFQVLVRKNDTKEIVWSSGKIFEFGTDTEAAQYPTDGSALPLESGVGYQWRVKKVGDHQGGSSNWQFFSIK
ncbi:MAG: hypothetical protein ABI444_09775 [Candidatus Kapaibacterium sp.]|jgi:hypothetical protein